MDLNIIKAVVVSFVIPCILFAQAGSGAGAKGDGNSFWALGWVLLTIAVIVLIRALASAAARAGSKGGRKGL
jgi:hypothetical protein